MTPNDELDKLKSERQALRHHLREVLEKYGWLLSQTNTYEAHHLGVYVTREAREIDDARRYLSGVRA